MALSETQVKAAQPKEKLYKMADERGLILIVMPNGSKYWRFRYRIDGKEQMMSLGVYPDVSLEDARQQRDELRKAKAQGMDPAVKRKIDKLTMKITFGDIAQEWLTRFAAQWSAKHAEKVAYRMQKDILPVLGNRPIKQITPVEILLVARKIEARGALESAHRAIGAIGQVMRYAVSTGQLAADPTPSLRGALPVARTQNHMAAPTDPKEVGRILRRIDAFEGTLQVGIALKLLPLVFCRPGELRHMRWSELDWEKAEWRFAASKTHVQHIVPLSRQAIELIELLHPVTGHEEFVFTIKPSNPRKSNGPKPFRNERLNQALSEIRAQHASSKSDTSKPFSETAMNKALRNLGLDTQKDITGHGWRAVARTLLAEELNYAPEVIEHQLAHAVPDALGRAHNRTRYLKQRKQMMQDWADYLDRLAADEQTTGNQMALPSRLPVAMMDSMGRGYVTQRTVPANSAIL